MSTPMHRASSQGAPLGAAGATSGAPGLRVLSALLAVVLVLRIAAMLAAGAGLYVDEAQYWDWSRDLQWGYWSKPPGVAVLIRASTELLGNGLLGVRLLGMLTWVAAAGVLWRLGRRIGGPALGWWTATLFLGTPASGVLGMVVTTDGPLVLCWCLAMLCTWEAIDHEDAAPRAALGWWGLAGLATGLGLLSKYTMGAVVLSGLVLLLQRPRRRLAGSLLAGVVALAVFAPNIVWNAANHWPTLGHTADITVNATSVHGLHRLGSVLEFGLGQLLMLGPVAWTVLVLARRRGSVATAGPADRAASFFALSFVLPLLAIGLLQAWHAKAQVNWAAPALAGACLWVALRARTLPLRLAWRALAAGVLLAALLSLLGTWTGRSGLDLWARMRGWDNALAALRPALDAHPDVPVAAEGRDLIVQAGYVWRDSGRRLNAWPERGRPSNHYAQFRPLHRAGQAYPAQVLVLTAGAPSPAMREAYGQWDLLARSQRRDTELQLWRASAPTGRGP